MAVLAPHRTAGNPYTAAADLIEALPALTKLARVKLDIAVKDQARQIGIQTLTLTRLESGSVPTQTTILRCLRWLAAQ